MDRTFADDLDAIAKIDAVQKILEVVCRTTGLGFSVVARVTETRWIALAVRDEIAFGLRPGGELELATTICDGIRQNGEPVAIDHVTEDTVFCNHLTPKKYGFQSYISVPIRLPDGRFFGTLCAIDPKPAHVNNSETIGMFKLFADLIALHLDAQDRMAHNRAALAEEQKNTGLREQFIAVLGHDLRNPLNAIKTGAQLLGMTRQSEDDAEIVTLIQRSVDRMAGLINNLVDFARGRLGGGFALHLVVESDLHAVLAQVVTELRTSWPARSIYQDVCIERPVSCDTGRLAQLLSNLLGNALTHGDPNAPIWVRGQTSRDSFELSVTNHGPTIPPEIISRLFQPFVRGAAKPGHQGLGLGLYIATEIARAHFGTLDVRSKDGQTCFTFRMPIQSA